MAKNELRNELRKLADTCDEAASRCQRVAQRVSFPPPGVDDIYNRIQTACCIWKTRIELSVELSVSEQVIQEYLQYLVRVQLLEVSVSGTNYKTLVLTIP